MAATGVGAGRIIVGVPTRFIPGTCAGTIRRVGGLGRVAPIRDALLNSGARVGLGSLL
jgi:hypothetical protein